MTEHRTVYLKDYTVPPFHVETVDLRFELDEHDTRVHARSALRRHPQAPAEASLRLDGQQLELLGVAVDGRVLAAEEYTLDADGMTLHRLPDAFVLEVETRIHPDANTALEGLYVSGGNFCTQCEAEGFRKITYYPDRPDVMARPVTHGLTRVPDRGVRCSGRLRHGDLGRPGPRPGREKTGVGVWPGPWAASARRGRAPAPRQVSLGPAPPSSCRYQAVGAGHSARACCPSVSVYEGDHDWLCCWVRAGGPAAMGERVPRHEQQS